MLPLPEFTASATLLVESTARAPGRLTVIAVLFWPAGVKLAVAWAVWFVGIITMRCKTAGSRRDTWSRLELKESAVLVKGWKATVEVPISSEEPVPVPVAPPNKVIGTTFSLTGSMKLIWLALVLGSATMIRRVMALKAIPTVVAETWYVRRGTPELAKQLGVVDGGVGGGHVEVSSLSA